MTCKVILILLIVSVAITVGDISDSRYSSNDTSTSNEAANRTLNIVEVADVTKDKINITVYYETLCPASIYFIVGRLKPAVEMLSSHLKIHLVPYGAATTKVVGGRYIFDCQHGQAECNGNMLHACVLDAVENRTEAILFNACLMQNRTRGQHISDLIPVLNWCGHKQKVLTQRIWDCMNTTRGSILLKEYGDETNAIHIEYIPHVMVDGLNSPQAFDDLLSTVCHMLRPKPSKCNDVDNTSSDDTTTRRYDDTIFE